MILKVYLVPRVNSPVVTSLTEWDTVSTKTMVQHARPATNTCQSPISDICNDFVSSPVTSFFCLFFLSIAHPFSKTFECSF